MVTFLFLESQPSFYYFRRYIISKPPSTVFKKHGQVLTIIKRSLLRIFFGSVRQKKSSKSRDTYMHTLFRYQIHPKGPSRIFSVTRKTSDVFSCDTSLYGLPQIWLLTNGQRQKFSGAPGNFQRQKNFEQKSRYPPPSYVKLFDNRKPNVSPNRIFPGCGTNFCDTALYASPKNLRLTNGQRRL